MEKILEIEEKYPELNCIKINGIEIWPFLRMSIRFHLFYNRQNSQNHVNKSRIRFRTILSAGFNFIYQIGLWIRPTKSFLISNVLEKKVVNGKVIDKLSQHLIDRYGKDILIFQAVSYRFKPKIQEAYINLAPWSKILPGLFKIKELHYSNGSVELLEKVLGEHHVKLKDVEEDVRDFFRQLKFWQIALKLKRPKYLFTECFSNFAAIYAANRLGIETIEFQHGLIGPNIAPYESKLKLNTNFRCKTVLLWGSAWSKNLSGNAISIQNVIPIGNYYLDLLEDSVTDKSFPEIKRGYKKIVTSALDSLTEDEILNLICEAAPKNPDLLFLIVPRLKISPRNASRISTFDNIRVINDKSFQEVIRTSDYYLATNSACLFEALKFGVPGIIIDKDGSCYQVFNHLTNPHTVKYISSSQQFNDVITNWQHPSKSEIRELSSHLYETNSKKRLSEFIAKSVMFN